MIRRQAEAMVTGIARFIIDPPSGLRVSPSHREFAPGTIQAIFRQDLRFLPDEELRPHFYGLE